MFTFHRLSSALSLDAHAFLQAHPTQGFDFK